MTRRLATVLLLLSVLFLVVACGNNEPLLDDFQLLVTVVGEGRVLPNGALFKPNTNISFDIVPAEGWYFDRWEGQNAQDLKKYGERWTLLMDSHKLLKAVFSQEKNDENYWQLSIQVLGEGTVIPISGSYKEGTIVTLNTLAKAGWNFNRWAGANSQEVFPSGKEWTICMNSDKALLAIFSRLEEENPQNYKLDITIVGKGTVEEKLINAQASDYLEGSTVRLWAKAAENYVFKEWRGQAYGQEPIFNLLMDEDKAVTAVFEERSYDLNITILGEGSVSEKLIRTNYPAGSLVMLTAKAAYGWSFSGWRGDARGSQTEIYLELDGPKEVTALFERQEVNLNIEIIGQGRVEESLISADYEYGSLVELKAVASRDWEFKEWQGDARGRKDTIELFMDEDKKIQAVFVKKDSGNDSFTIKIKITGQGEVEEILLKALANNDYPSGSLVKLIAKPASAWKFKQWLGDASGSDSEIEIKMDGDKEVEAVFEKMPQGNGEVSGQITISHAWPHPQRSQGRMISSPTNSTGKLPVLDYANLRLVPRSRDKCVPGELVVGFDRGMLLAEEEQGILKALGLQVELDLAPINAYLVKAPEVIDDFTAYEEAEKLKDRLMAHSNNIRYVEPNYYVYMLANESSVKHPNDPLYARQWHYLQIRLPQAWSVTRGSKSVRIAVLDTGINPGHPDLGDNIDVASGWNFVNNDSDSTDREGHGSHCAGTIAANTNNGLGIAGVMWEANVIPVKVLSDKGTGTMTGAAAGILYASGIGEKALANPAQVLSMSFGGAFSNEALKDACDRAAEAGVLVVAASGNDNGPVGYPAAYDSVICVGASNYNYPNEPARAYYSSYGPEMDIVAPGGDTEKDTDKDGHKDGVLSTSFYFNMEFAYLNFNGTSMACPHAAGVIGLMLANGVPASEVRETLHRTAFDLGAPGFDNEFGHGLTNTYWAINNVKDIKIVVGTREGNRIEAVAEGTVDLKAKTYSLNGIPKGEYQVFGWIDVQGTGSLDPGDYLYVSDKINFNGTSPQTVNMNLRELE